MEKSPHDLALRRFERLQRFLPLVFITLLPIALTSNVWRDVWRGGRVRASDGSGHYAITQIYAQTIFPDTFGWTHSYFGGLPFPNFYPPLFQWMISLLHQTGLCSFDFAFKLVVALPLWLLPAAVWMLARRLSEHNENAALIAAFGSHLLLLVPQIQPLFFGLSYLSTLAVGLYTQPLGFVLLIVWYSVYLNAHQRRYGCALAGVLLALTVLGNFFSAITAALLVTATLIGDGVSYLTAKQSERWSAARDALLAHSLAPLIAAGLAAFWLVPMVTDYGYLVTRPITISLRQHITPALWCWYVLAAGGLFYWLRRPTRAMWPFVFTCLALAGSVIFAQTVAPRWFPFQSYRFLATLNFLLALPVSYGVLGALRALAGLRKKRKVVPSGKIADQVASQAFGSAQPQPAGRRFTRLAVVATLVLLLIGVVGLRKPSPYIFAFYSAASNERIDGVLRFAAARRAGRYLVEVPPPADPADWYDSFALNSYLGAQGNETVSVVFRESSPNAPFFYPLVNAFSAYKDSFGLSSVLADDLDFDEQPLARHLERTRLIGARYLAIASPAMKERLAQEPGIKARADFGVWSVFELRDEPPPRARALPFKPALVVSDFSFKERRRHAYDFVRWAEEQFASGWFDVLLARAPEMKLDRLPRLEGFGALILDDYQCDDEQLVLTRLREFARARPLILLARETPLFHRLRTALADLPQVQIIERSAQATGGWLEVYEPGQRYGASPIRREWEAIRHILDREKIATDATVAFGSQFSPTAIQVNFDRASIRNEVPVLISTTYFPAWQRDDGAAIYPATPFFMLTFVEQSNQGTIHLRFARRAPDWVGLWFSVGTLALIFVTMIRKRRRDLS